MSSSQANFRNNRAALTLDFPQSLGVYNDYADAQKTVDFLSDHEFPVENCMIVGTELKQVERVTGRLTYNRVAVGGLLSGVWIGLFFGVIFMLVSNSSTSPLAALLPPLLIGAVMGLIWALVGYAATRGQRDFSSVSRIVATRYEVLVEHKLAAQGRELLTQLPGHTASQQGF